MGGCVRPARGFKGKCDRLFSLQVRSKGRCERCGSSKALQTAHIVSRRYSATRCDHDNALCLCAKCHLFFTGHPVEWTRFLNSHIGEAEYDRLYTKATSNSSVWDWEAEYERLLGWTPTVRFTDES